MNNLLVMNDLEDGGSDLADHFNHKYTCLSLLARWSFRAHLYVEPEFLTQPFVKAQMQ